MIIEAKNDRGFANSDYTRRGLFVAVVNHDDYDGGGYNRHKGLWVVFADEKTGQLYSEPLSRCRVVLDK